MKIILKDKTLQVNDKEPFNEYESTVSATPRIGESLRIEGMGIFKVTEVIHDLSIFDNETYSFGETFVYVEQN